MKYIKMLGLLAVAAAALMAFVGTASAATATAPAGTLYTNTLKASSTNATLHNAFGTIECESKVEGKVETHGKNAKGETLPHVAGKISSLSFGATVPCVGGSVHNAKIVPGSLTVTSAGTVTSIGATVTITMFGEECSYSSGAGLDIGTLTDAGSSTGHAVLHIKAALPRHAGSFFCGSSGNWTGTYTVTTPTGFVID